MSLLGTFFGTKPKAAADEAKSVLDLVTYAAGLVSNPDSINTALDKVRDITSRLEPGQQPAPDTEKQLLSIYLQIESYLTTKEPLRAFTKQDLRKRIAGPLLAQLTAHETNQNAAPSKT